MSSTAKPPALLHPALSAARPFNRRRLRLALTLFLAGSACFSLAVLCFLCADSEAWAAQQRLLTRTGPAQIKAKAQAVQRRVLDLPDSAPVAAPPAPAEAWRSKAAAVPVTGGQ